MRILTDRNIVIGLVLLQVAVCLPFITSFPIALDEPFSIFWAQQDLGDLFLLFENENNPPLHFVLLHFWIKFFGISEIAVRSLSLIFSLITIPIIFNFAKRFVTQPLAVLTVLLFICSRFNHFHALEARVYSLFVLLFVLVLFDLYRFLFENKKSYFQLALWNVLLLYSHYLGGFVIIVEIIVILLFYRQLTMKKGIQLTMSFGLSALLYIPGLILFLKRFGTFSDKGTWVPEAQYSEIYGNIIRFFNNTFTFFVIAGLIFLFLIIFRKNIMERFRRIFTEPKYLFIFCFFVFAYFGMFIFSKIIQPVFLDRYLLFTTIPLFLFLVIILGELLPKDKQQWGLIIIIPMLISTKWIPDNNRNPDEEAKYVREIISDKSLIAICPPFYDLTFIYHYNQKLFSDYKNFDERKNEKNIQSIYSFEDIENWDNFPEIIFIDANSQFTYPGNNIKSELEKRFVIQVSNEFDGGIIIYNFVQR